jgi:hypothetical protein
LESARNAIRAQAAARERAERALADAQATIRDLQTKLAHERMAKDEAIRRVDTERSTAQQAWQALQDELASERQARGRLAVELRESQETHRALETQRALEIRRADDARRAEAARQEDDRQRAGELQLTQEIEPAVEQPIRRKRGRPPTVKLTDVERGPAQSAKATGVEPSRRRKTTEMPSDRAPDRQISDAGQPEPEGEAEPVQWWVKGWQKQVARKRR